MDFSVKEATHIYIYTHRYMYVDYLSLNHEVTNEHVSVEQACFIINHSSLLGTEFHHNV